jgi:small subunit ribosomal protein S15
MDRATKKKAITSFQTHKKDTGSSVVQVAILTERIKQLSEHLQTHKKDDHSRRGLLGLVAKRRRHLHYLRLRQPEVHAKLVEELSLR